jgi:hypothetical protein
LLTELILDAPYPPYNSARRPSSRGRDFLGALDDLCFGQDAVAGTDLVFVDEIDFPARHADEKGCAPDYTVFVEGRCWIIELKTEPGSHRPRQIPDYFERAHHYHPDRRVDITYLTAALRAPFHPQVEDWGRYVHVEWSGVAELIRSVWSTAGDERVLDVLSMLLAGIALIDEPIRSCWARLGYDLEPAAVAGQAATEAPASPEVGSLTIDSASVAVAAGLALARDTAADGRQRAIGLDAGGLDALHDLRLQLRQAIRAEPADSPLRYVQPWMWSAASAGGTAMTAAGLQAGYEVRLSRSRIE